MSVIFFDEARWELDRLRWGDDNPERIIDQAFEDGRIIPAGEDESDRAGYILVASYSGVMYYVDKNLPFWVAEVL